MESKKVEKVEQSLFFARNGGGGVWQDAVWSASVTDDETGEVLALAANPDDAGIWAMVGVRLGREFLATLRALAGVDQPLPGARERAEAAYWRECAQHAAEMLARGRSAGGDWASAALGAESYLRQTLATERPAPGGSRAPDGSEPCYDCRTLTERVDTIERRQEEDAVTFGEHARRLTSLETAMRSEHRMMHGTFNQHEARLDKLETALLGDADRYGNLVGRVKALERQMTEASNYAIPLAQDAAKQLDKLEIDTVADRHQLHALANRVDALEAWRQACDDFDGLMTQLSAGNKDGA